MKLVATNVLLYKNNSRKKLCISPTIVIANDAYELEPCLRIMFNFIMVHIKMYFYSLVFRVGFVPLPRQSLLYHNYNNMLQFTNNK